MIESITPTATSPTAHSDGRADHNHGPTPARRDPRRRAVRACPRAGPVRWRQQPGRWLRLVRVRRAMPTQHRWTARSRLQIFSHTTAHCGCPSSTIPFAGSSANSPTGGRLPWGKTKGRRHQCQHGPSLTTDLACLTLSSPESRDRGDGDGRGGMRIARWEHNRHAVGPSEPKQNRIPSVSGASVLARSARVSRPVASE